MAKLSTSSTHSSAELNIQDLSLTNKDENPHPQPPQIDDSVAATNTIAEAGNKPPQTSFTDLPTELREMIWHYALPDPRVFNALVYASAGLKMQLLERESLKMPLAHACFESRQVVKKAGYILAFRDEDEPDDPGVWFHPRRDVIERTLWGPGDFWGLDPTKGGASNSNGSR
ncbi:uncharacterized protein F4822DRAFT_224589 [Hypoxylon trugodes]|uniref:uncharacterized protein n=1 Tax=Hypoxylon trugodes TaxID=326681 RepID=UPI002194A08A|nr:uncharacterized protein F4822DRAFT_224589 [Hypoxylon trugodes]KAI1390109.1 hypothetical protein F4822DRAFT_224589 [Hypoxylon trugodes]